VGLPRGKYGPEVGALAEKAGISPRTIKHCEDFGCISKSKSLCTLIQDLQRFGCSLDEIKIISDYFRDFLMLQTNLNSVPKKVADAKFQAMLDTIEALFTKTDLLKKGIQRWEELLKKRNFNAQKHQCQTRPRKERKVRCLR